MTLALSIGESAAPAYGGLPPGSFACETGCEPVQESFACETDEETSEQAVS